MKNENWKIIDEYPTYQVSNFGRVRSYKSRNIVLQVPQVKKSEIDVCGYERVSLCKNSICKHHKVHRLVAKSFIKNTGEKSEVNHKDGNRINNNVENLEWVSRSENMVHAFRVNGAKPMCGEKNGHARLSARDVRSIRKLWKDGGLLQREIAQMYGIARTTVNAIVNGYNWKHNIRTRQA